MNELTLLGAKKYFLFDSRQLLSPTDSVFFALKTKANDGHRYIQNLYNKGVDLFVVNKSFDTSLYPSARFIAVDDPLIFLQMYATYHRTQYDIPVIGITGSNGKTIVKEWLSTLLAIDTRVVKSPKSYNSQLGVALSLSLLSSEYEIGIFEAGVSKTGEMDVLATMLQPSIGVMTNVGSAHDEGFLDRQQKIAEKLKLFADIDALIYCIDHIELQEQIAQLDCEKWSWGSSSDARVRCASREVLGGKRTSITLFWEGEYHTVILPFSDRASFENGMHCITCMLYLGYDIPQISERLSQLSSVDMRLSLKRGINGCKIIDDTYSNDVVGLSVALDFMKNQASYMHKTVILSDIAHTDIGQISLYEQISHLLVCNQISRFIGIGPVLSSLSSLFDEIPKAVFYPDVDTLLSDMAINQKLFHEEVILVKGARAFSFERIVHVLQQQLHGTRLEIDLEVIANNLRVYRQSLQPSTKIMVMVKAFAYGSSRHELAHWLQYNHVDYFGVAFADEGVELRQNGIHLPIMVLSPSIDSLRTIIDYGLQPQIYSLHFFEELITVLSAHKIERRLPVHISFDTGMHRLGFEEQDWDKLCSLLDLSRNMIEVIGVFTHLVGADEQFHNDYSLCQIESFRRRAEQLETFLGHSVIKHVLNSAGITRFPEHQFDMVRLGIGLYGVDPNAVLLSKLQPVSTLKTTIVQIKDLPEGETVGYGRKGLLNRPSKIATIGIGYADGFDRRFSRGVGYVLINGKRAYVVGNVCMDMCMVDVTDIEVSEGDDVIVFGENPHVSDLAEKIGTIPYELLTGINDRVKRIFFSS